MAEKNEIKEARNEVSRIVKKPVENVYGLANLVRVFLARAIDMLILAIPSILVMWLWKPNMSVISDPNNPAMKIIVGKTDWVYTVVNLCITLAEILFFLVIIPSFTNGTTIGKAICGIRLRRSKGDKKVKWYMLLARESYFLLIPWLMALIMKVIAIAVLLSSHRTQTSGADVPAQIINQLGYIFYFLWFIFLLVTIRAQSEHQAGIDMYFGLFVVYKEPIKQVVKEEVVKERSLILTDEPGNLTKKEMDELRNDEETKFNKSISLEDLDLKVDQDLLDHKKKTEDTKKIESKDNKKDKHKGDKK